MVRKATLCDSLILAELAVQMWDSHTIEELADAFRELLQSENAACFLKYVSDIPVGFAQCSLRRDYVEGTETSPVGYLEGIFVAEDHRHKGYAKELLLACELWAKHMGCREFASDCELDNAESLQFHLATGFAEANRMICFTKQI